MAYGKSTGGGLDHLKCKALVASAFTPLPCNPPKSAIPIAHLSVATLLWVLLAQLGLGIEAPLLAFSGFGIGFVCWFGTHLAGQPFFE